VSYTIHFWQNAGNTCILKEMWSFKTKFPMTCYAVKIKRQRCWKYKKKRMLLRFTYLQNLLFVVGKSMNIYHNSFIWVFRVYLKIELETCETRIQVWIWGGGGSGMIGFQKIYPYTQFKMSDTFYVYHCDLSWYVSDCTVTYF
jgi:hypothetical protein